MYLTQIGNSVLILGGCSSASERKSADLLTTLNELAAVADYYPTQTFGSETRDVSISTKFLNACK